MRVTLAAIGVLGTGPERTLTDRYIDRAAAVGRGHGLSPVEEVELDNRRCKSKDDEAALLLGALDAGTVILALDERGEDWASRRLAETIARHRDDGARRLALLIGGADGHGAAIRSAAHAVIAFGRQTWPHRLVRVMAAEQIYRAASLLAGAPYHRD